MGIRKEILIGLFVTVVGGIILFFVQDVFFTKSNDNTPEKDVAEVTELFIKWYEQKMQEFHGYNILKHGELTPANVDDTYDIFTDDFLKSLSDTFNYYYIEYGDNSMSNYELNMHKPWLFGGQDEPDLEDFNKKRVVFEYRVLSENVRSGNAVSLVSWSFEDNPNGEIKKMDDEYNYGTKLRLILENNMWRIRKITD